MDSEQRPDATIVTKVRVLRRERAARPQTLEIVEGEGTPQSFLLDKAELTIGRSAEAEIRIASPRASRQHAVLVRRGAEFLLRDNDSHNGVYLNGVKIHSALLRDGDVIQIGDVVLLFREG
jgi:pSer/pThr/pTyr-binding forkhead associated (FHA) protein